MKIIGEGYYALLCNCGYDRFKSAMLCGVYSSKEEAEIANKEVEDCVAKHKIKKVKVTVEYK